MSEFQKINMGAAKWISTAGKCSTPLIRRVYPFPKVQKAELTIAGLGIYEVYINGKRVGDDMFLPLTTDFNQRDHVLYGGEIFKEEMEHRLYCPVYDVTSYLTEGDNTICFMMGPGWYERPRLEYGNIKLCYRLDYTDFSGISHVCYSEERHQWKEGFVKEADLITGESHDYRDYDEAWMGPEYMCVGWEDVTVEAPPETKLYKQECPADKVIRHIKPRLIRDQDGVKLYDAGEVMSGYPILVSESKVPVQVQVRYGETLNSRGGLDEEHMYHQHTDFWTDGTKRELHARFTWLCFRYFEVTGDAEAIDCLVIHSFVPVTSAFHCDSAILNWIWEAYIRTQLANMHGGIPSDCPHAERRGYTGDGQLTCRAAMLQLDAQRFYKKWIYDIADCQDRKTGHVQYTAPFQPSGGGPGGWGCAIVMVPYAYYQHYGDESILRELYPQMLQWFTWMEAHSRDELVVSDIPNVWCLGDWCAPAMSFNELNAMVLPEPLVNTYFYIKSLETVLDIQRILNISEDTEMLQSRICRKKQAIIDAYFEPDTGNFAGNLQGSNVYAVDLGLGDERTYQNMLEHYRTTGKYDTGIFATDILTRVLFERGEEELAIALLTSKEADSFYAQMQKGATTISEYWSGFRSQCHPMFGAVTRYLFEYVLGIRQEEQSVCFERVIIQPKCMKQVQQAEGHVTTRMGEIKVAYDQRMVEVNVPEGIQAELRLAGKSYPLQAGKQVFFINR